LRREGPAGLDPVDELGDGGGEDQAAVVALGLVDHPLDIRLETGQTAG